MAKPIGVWGIDIGQCALKTLRCHMEGDKVVADAFDYIEYPKILSQPEANPVELVKEALEQFLSRNDVKGDRVAVAVPGQAGLARYFKPPPVDAKKIADIVKYEAKQQIPFPLEDVIWDYQRMGGGMEVDGIALETEVGLFAMKRDQVYKSLQPFTNAGIEVDIIQLAPLSIYNYVVYDLLEKTLPPPDQFDPEAPPPSTVVISVGTDTTDLVVTNGYRVWQRNIPLGGNHFTKQLTKELKLTFAKAEHLKRNAHQAEDPKAVFQAMRPIFNDMVTELQRSLGYFQSLDRKAEINNVVILGNTVKLPGLKQYLTKHLGYNVIDFDHYERIGGDAVVKAPAFRDNLLAFGVCYGLCLQGLDHGRLGTNLLPQEITTERLIRAKKPWAVATAGAFLLACALNYMFHYVAWKDVHADDWKGPLTQAKSVVDKSGRLVKEDGDQKKKLEDLQKIGTEVIGSADRRLLWLELLKAVNESLPQTPGRKPGEVLDPSVVPFKDQQELHITSIESQYYPDLKLWWANPAVQRAYQNVLNTEKETSGAGAVAAAPAGGNNPAAAVPAPGNGVPPAATPAANTPAPGPATTPAGPAAPSASIAAPTATGTDTPTDPGPSGPGYIIELTGFHYYNDLTNASRPAGQVHVRQTLIRNLMEGDIQLPAGPGAKEPLTFTMKDLGIAYPIFAYNGLLDRNAAVPNPYYQEENKVEGFGATGMRPPGSTKPKEKKKKDAPEIVESWPAVRYDFTIQFVWQEKPLNVRLEAKRKLESEKNNGLTNVSAPAVPAALPVEEEAVAPVEQPAKKPAAVAEPMPEPVDVAEEPAIDAAADAAEKGAE